MNDNLNIDCYINERNYRKIMFASESIQILMDKINPTVIESLNYMYKLNKNILETMEGFFKILIQ